MDKSSMSENKELNDLKVQVEALNKRVVWLENKIKDQPSVSSDIVHSESEDDEDFRLNAGIQGELLETKIGEHGMAWLGNIVLLFGIIFLMQLFHNKELRLLSSLLGFVVFTGVYLIAFAIRRQYQVMSKLLTINGHILMFYTILRLHFSSDPVVPGLLLGLVLVLGAVAVLFYLSYRLQSQILAGISIVMGMVVAIFSNSTHIMLPIMTLIAIVAVIYTRKFEWWTILIISEILVYLTYMLWLLNNPLITHKIEAVSEHQMSQLYLFGNAFIYSMLALFKPKQKTTARLVNGSLIINGLGFSLTMMLVILTYFQEDYVRFLGLISAFCIGYAVILQSRGTWKLPSALYALYGFVVLSIAISIYFGFPLAFFLLSLQSLLVVSMALWFRSRFIVIMNVILFIGLLTTYLLLKDPIHSANFSFALISLITARIINWKKSLLEIKTEFIRNLYLFSGFVMVLTSLYYAVPDRFESLSWTGAALLFFIMSLVLSNVKYRYLAIATMVVTTFHVFLFDLKNVSIGYRVMALMFLAAIALGLSIFYARRKRE